MSTKCTVCYDEKPVTDDSTGEVICRSCGTVLAENIEVSSERRAFTKEEFESRTQTGAPTSLARHDMGLSTIISRVNKDASGRKINASMKATMDRLRTWDFRTQAGTPTDRNLMYASNELSKLKHKLALTDVVIEKAAYIYRKAQQRKLVRGRTMISLVAASLYAACRELDAQRTLKDIADESNIKVKDLARSYRLLLKESMGLAAAALYLISLKNNEIMSQKQLAEAAGVTEVTIRNRAKELKKNHSDLFTQ